VQITRADRGERRHCIDVRSQNIFYPLCRNVARKIGNIFEFCSLLPDGQSAKCGLSQLESINQPHNNQFHYCYFKHVVQHRVFPHQMAHLHVESLFSGLHPTTPPKNNVRRHLKTVVATLYGGSQCRGESIESSRFRAKPPAGFNIIRTFGKHIRRIHPAVLT